MIYRASIGELCILLDDEMIEERPTPEVAEDYLTRCINGVIEMYTQIPDPEPAQASDDGGNP